MISLSTAALDFFAKLLQSKPNSKARIFLVSQSHLWIALAGDIVTTISKAMQRRGSMIRITWPWCCGLDLHARYSVSCLVKRPHRMWRLSQYHTRLSSAIQSRVQKKKSLKGWWVDRKHIMNGKVTSRPLSRFNPLAYFVFAFKYLSLIAFYYYYCYLPNSFLHFITL